MHRLISVVKVLLLVSIAILLFAVGANLVTGIQPGFLTLSVALVSGIFAFWMLSTANIAQVRCPACGTLQPKWRKPTSFGQMMWGGWTCTNCGTNMDRDGHVTDRKA